MADATLNIYVSYGQICVFESDLDNPFNDWSDVHIRQGFSWRPGSASFLTLEETGQHLVVLRVCKEDRALSADAVRIIEVPFEVPTNGNVEVASITDGQQISIPAGSYTLRAEFLTPGGEKASTVELTFISESMPSFSVTRADAELDPPENLLLEANPA